MLRNKFRWTEAQIEEGLRRITAMARIVKPVVLLDVIKDDPPDNRILETRVTGGSHYIITGDSHLLRLGRYDAIRILKPADFLDLVRGVTL